MQTITPALEAILKSRFQAAADGFRARLDVATYVPVGDPTLVYQEGNFLSTANNWFPAVPPAVGDLLIMGVAVRNPGLGVSAILGLGSYTDWNIVPPGTMTTNGWGSPERQTAMFWKVAEEGEVGWFLVGDQTVLLYSEWSGAGSLLTSVGKTLAGISLYVDTGGEITIDERALVIGVMAANFQNDTETMITAPIVPNIEFFDKGGASVAPGFWMAYRVEEPGSYTVEGNATTGSSAGVGQAGITAAFIAGSSEGPADRAVWTPYRIKSVSIDKSLRLDADQAEIVLENEDLRLGWGPTSIFRTNQRIRVYQWYGENENIVRSFTGIIDKIHDGRDVLTTTLSCRDMMGVAIDTTFSSIGPQGADEDGAVRTVENGVYLSMEVSDIVRDIILNRVGWDPDAVEITPTSYVLDEFIISDGDSYAAAIIGDERLSGLVGYSAWADEEGVFHFAPTQTSNPLTDPEDPVYTYRTGEDIIQLDDETDQYDLRTRVKARGPLTTQTLQDTWRELWRTKKFHLPVGLWHDPTDAANLRVLDRGTKRMYKLRQSDRAVLSSVNIEPIVAHPLGLSGDPADSSVYWVLNAPWIDGVSGTNRVKKVRKSDNHVLASFDLPSGHWSALKVSSSFLWLTNLSTDRFYKRSKSDGSAIASYQHTYNSNLQANPSGLMINGTKLHIFWANGGSTARFLVCDESAPTVIEKVVKTAGTTLHGGEFDTVTDTECYGDSDSLGLVAKFTLINAVDQTNEVFAEVVDSDLEDELGQLALLGNRVHDTHPDDDGHPFEVRRMTLNLTVITSLAQATETAQRQLDLASVRRRALDVGMVGNPALQKTDLIAVVDPVTGISTSFVLDTVRTDMNDGTYLGTAVGLPVEEFDDDPDDEGDATEDDEEGS